MKVAMVWTVDICELSFALAVYCRGVNLRAKERFEMFLLFLFSWFLFAARCFRNESWLDITVMVRTADLLIRIVSGGL